MVWKIWNGISIKYCEASVMVYEDEQLEVGESKSLPQNPNQIAKKKENVLDYSRSKVNGGKDDEELLMFSGHPELQDFESSMVPTNRGFGAYNNAIFVTIMLDVVVQLLPLWVPVDSRGLYYATAKFRTSTLDLLILTLVRVMSNAYISYKGPDVSNRSQARICGRVLFVVTFVSIAYAGFKAAYYFFTIGNELRHHLPMQGLKIVLASACNMVLSSTEDYMIRAALNGQYVDETYTKDGTNKKPSMWRLLSFAMEDWPWFLAAFFFLVIAAVGNIFIPLLTGKAIDAAAFNGVHDNKTFVQYILYLCLAAAVTGICSGLRGACFNTAAAKIGYRMRRLLYSSIMAQELGFFDDTETGDITSRLTSDVTKVVEMIPLNINVFLRSIVQGVGVVVLMASLNWELTLITFASVPLVTVISKFYGNYYQKLSKKVQDSLASANNVAEQTISSIRTVRSFAYEKGEVDRYSEELMVAYRLKIHQAIVYVGYMSVFTMLPLLVTALVLWYGGVLIGKGQITGGVLISFAFYQVSLSEAINEIGWVFSGMMDALGASEKVLEYIDRTPKSPEYGDVKPKTIRGEIEFRDVSFSYPTRPEHPVLNSVSFKAHAGETVALVGASGGGKSSIIALLERFYETTQGTILLDGLDINSYDHDSYHKAVVLVGQEPVLTADTIAKNICYGLMPPPIQSDLEKAAKMANCHNFATSFQEGYDTKTGEKGVQLSGGQKQRVAIARALVRNPAVLLLDEATSALDADSESIVQQAIEKNLTGHTVLMIAHRLSTVKDADRIVVLDKGVVVEVGSHRELLEKQGYYFRLVQHQLMEEDVRSVVSLNGK
eukprot:m.199762 g.199762  ORF g.199762 m.199762 type:complete len:832 (-) comp15729_c0_seq11:1660-4155(-)